MLESIRSCIVCTTSELILGYRYVVELLTEAVSFVEKLESHLQSAKSIPQIPTLMKNMVSSKKKKLLNDVGLLRLFLFPASLTGYRDEV